MQQTKGRNRNVEGIKRRRGIGRGRHTKWRPEPTRGRWVQPFL